MKLNVESEYSIYLCAKNHEACGSDDNFASTRSKHLSGLQMIVRAVINS